MFLRLLEQGAFRTERQAMVIYCQTILRRNKIKTLASQGNATYRMV